jgi:U2 small nuclear ribonucleoprotein A'
MPGRQHYRLYTIRHIPSLKVLDMQKVSQSERNKAERLAKSAAGAALESDVAKEASKTFEPGVGQTADESFQTSFTPEQKEQIRQLVAAAKSPQEIEQIEDYVQRGVFPSHLLPKTEEMEREERKRPAETNENGDADETNHKEKKARKSR